MSLILEALRKSEAERQRGRAPGLFVEQQGLQRREGRRPPLWALVLTALVVALGAGWGWREWNRGADDVAPAAAPDVAVAAPAVATPAPAIVAPPPMRAPIPAPPPPAPADPTARPLPPPALDPATLPILPAARAEPVAEAAATTDAGRLTTDALPPPPAAAPPEESLPRLGDLPAGERAAMPPLRLSMHVYSDDPARRFVIVDEQRLTEGASPAPGLVVEQIRRDGAVLSFNGRRLLLPRP
jgi:general secretion pathway protein B